MRFTLAVLILFSLSLTARASEFTDWVVQHQSDVGGFSCHVAETLRKQYGEVCAQDTFLTSDERCAVTLYTLTAYLNVNEILRSRSYKIKDIQPFTETLSQALRKLPAQSGMAYRYLRLAPKQIKDLKVGATVTQRGYTSTSINPNWIIAGKDFGNVFLRIHTQKGHDVHCYSTAVNEEKEWLLDRDSVFLIDKVVTTDDGAEIDVTDVTQGSAP